VLSSFSVDVIKKIRKQPAVAVKTETLKVDLRNCFFSYTDAINVFYMLLQRHSAALSSSTLHTLP